ALLDRFLRETQKMQQRDMPPWVRSLQQSGAAGSPSAGLRMMLPRQATVAVVLPGKDGEAGFVAAINPRGMTRLLYTILDRQQTRAGRYRGRDLLQLGAASWAALLDGTFLVASDEATLRRGMDRLLAGATTPPPPPPNLGAPARAWDLTGIIGGGDRRLEELLWGEGLSPRGAGQAAIGVDVATSDLTAGRIAVDCDSPAAAADAAVALQQRAGERAQRLAERGLVLRATSRVDGARAVLDWELSGVEEALATWVASSQESPSTPPTSP
ncbi:MAG TPA: hypothetical protein VGV61_11565, partial [Thermoanaerobaculia bacterium]|nr:hypothetical protein [Thermoanaerobaculia bacterium]